MKAILLAVLGFLFMTQAQANEAAKQTKPSTGRHWLFSGSVGLYGNGALNLTMMSTDGIPLQQHVDSSLRFAVETAYIGRQSWGFNLGLSLDSTKQIENSNDSVPDFVVAAAIRKSRSTHFM